MRTLAHITHEAVAKVGGIGAVLQGLLTCEAYRTREQRTVLIGPVFATEGGTKQRLGTEGEVLYSSMDGITSHPVARALEQVRKDYHVELVYGHRRFTDPHSGVHVSPEVVMIDVSRVPEHRTNNLKARLWEAYGIDSARHEQCWEYDLYVKLAEPALAVLKALGAADTGDECVILAHEWMGLPTALTGLLDPSGAFRAIFYAHEVSAMRRIVEEHPGHDVSFYNVMSRAMNRGRYVDDVFGPQDYYYRHELVQASHHCDRILSVGDYVTRELRFIGPEFASAAVETCYNGIPSETISLDDKKKSGQRLRRYAEALLGDRPDYLFTHVTRTLTSKGLWRDITVLEHMEHQFRKTGQTGVLFVLSTEVPPRQPEDIAEMERWWQWPVAHREGGTDLSGGEAIFYQGVQAFNARSRQIKVIYVNQFGFDRQACGHLMPPDMEFMDIRRGSDVEFGQSIYEPFGIAQLEPLTFGGICVPTHVCGCTGFVEAVSEGPIAPNVIVANYCELPPGKWTEKSLLELDRDFRSRHERSVAEGIARRVLEALPASDAETEALMQRGRELASLMSWDVVARRYVLPAIDGACARRATIRVA